MTEPQHKNVDKKKELVQDFSNKTGLDFGKSKMGVLHL